MANKVHILTNFAGYLKSYSPIIVVQSQLQQLTRAGYSPVLLVSESWNPPEGTIYSEVETVKLPEVPYSESLDSTFDRDVNLLYEKLKETLPDDAVVLTHDLIFLPDYTKHNVAARKLAEEKPTIRWIHTVHSATGPNTLIAERSMYSEKYKELLLSKFPNSVISYPNSHDIPRVARNFGYGEEEVFEVPHATDPVEGMHHLVKELYDKKDLGSVEVLSIAPMRMDRGKNPHMIVRAQKGFKDADMTSHIIFCDFQSTGDDKVVYREECKKLAEELGVADRVTFLSEFNPIASLEVDHKIILDLFTLSNVFFLPSRSETYSLVAQEAMLKGNLCILNYDFPAFRQIYGKKAIYRQFDGAEIAHDGFDGKIDTTHSNIEAYMKDRMALAIKAWIKNDKVLSAKTWVRTKRNPDFVFRNYLEPLLGIKDEDVIAEV
jgi:glycosyltransferase involved in cell wall biosynthesis